MNNISQWDTQILLSVSIRSWSLHHISLCLKNTGSFLLWTLHHKDKWQGSHINRLSYSSLKQCPSISIYLTVSFLLTIFLAFHPLSIHLNQRRRFYVWPVPQGSAKGQSSSKQCLLSRRRWGLSGQPGCSSLPYETIKVNDLTLASRLQEDGLKI